MVIKPLEERVHMALDGAPNHWDVCVHCNGAFAPEQPPDSEGEYPSCELTPIDDVPERIHGWIDGAGLYVCKDCIEQLTQYVDRVAQEQEARLRRVAVLLEKFTTPLGEDVGLHQLARMILDAVTAL